VFFINVPVGILCLLGVLTFMRETRPRTGRFDFFGFAMLSLAVGGLQMMLDRGQSNDWFNSTETWIEAGASALCMYLFIVHLMTTRRQPFISPALFKDSNFLTGNIFIFIVGVVLFATLALLPPLLQGLLNYPVVLTGLVTAPRGIGTLAAMAVVRQLMGRIDNRWIIGAGLLMTAGSLWQMTGFDLRMGQDTVIWSGLLQGFGTGFVFVSLSAVAFATLAPALRNEGTALFSLMRNLGSSIGISAVTSLLTRNTQIMHSRLAEHVTPYADALNPLAQASLPGGLAAIDGMVTRQAAMIAYTNDFKLMLLLTLCALPLVWLLRPVRRSQPAQMAVVE
jgi:DHA2 family multidrug resistance protein